MIKFATPLCHSKDIQFSIECNNLDEEMIIPGEIRQNVFIVFKEAIINMVKYAGATECITSISINNDRFVLRISDNGKGTDGTIKGSGEGWKNMHKRTELLGGELAMEKKPGNGFTVTVSLPYPFKIPDSWEINKA